MAYALMEIARKQSSTVKILCAGAGSVLSTFVFAGLAASDTRSLQEKVNEHMQKMGVSIMEAAEAVSTLYLS